MREAASPSTALNNTALALRPAVSPEYEGFWKNRILSEGVIVRGVPRRRRPRGRNFLRHASHWGALLVFGTALLGCSSADSDAGEDWGGTAGSGAVSAGGGKGNSAGKTSGGGGSGGTGSGGTAPTVFESPKLCALNLTCTKAILDNEKIDCQLAARDGQDILIYEGTAGVEIRGRSSTSFPKKNYSVELRLATGEENPTNLLGMGKESDWVLDGCWADRSFLRNALSFDTFRSFSAEYYAPRSRFCTLALNGKPQGIYRLGERIKRDDDRVNIAEDDGTGASFIIQQQRGGPLNFPLGADSGWELVYPRQENATATQKNAAKKWLDQLKAALPTGSNSTPDTGVFALLDFERTVDWVLLEEFAKNIDAYNLSIFLARNAGGSAWPIPWDLDLAYGQPTVTGLDEIKDNELPQGWVASRGSLISALSKSPSFRERLASRWTELRSTALATPTVLARMDAYETSLAPTAVAENFKIWPITEVDYKDIYAPYTLYRVASHAEEFTRIRAWITRRLEWIDANIGEYPGGR